MLSDPRQTQMKRFTLIIREIFIMGEKTLCSDIFSKSDLLLIKYLERKSFSCRTEVLILFITFTWMPT